MCFLSVLSLFGYFIGKVFLWFQHKYTKKTIISSDEMCNYNRKNEIAKFQKRNRKIEN
jgi:phosphopantetheine adenylyltransferase